MMNMNFLKDRSLGYVLTIVVGILMLIDPSHVSNLVFKIVGAIVAVNAVVGLVVGGKVTAVDRDGLSMVGSSLLRLAIGLILFFKSTWLVGACSTVFGIFLILDGLAGAVEPGEASAAKVLHLLVAFFGLLLLVHPFSLWFTLLRWSGIALILDGAVGMVTDSSLMTR